MRSRSLGKGGSIVAGVVSVLISIPMISTSDNLFGVKSDKSVRSDGEDELEGFVGVRRIDEEGRFA